MNGTKFKVLMHMDMYVDTRLLHKVIYGRVKPTVYSYDETIESLVEKAIKVQSMAPPEFVNPAYIDNLKQCELVPVVIMKEGEYERIGML